MQRPAMTERAPRSGTHALTWALLGILAVLISPLTSPWAGAQGKFPPLTGRVVDEVGLLSADDRQALQQELEALEKTSSDQLIVYVTRSLQGYGIEDFGYQVGRAWKIGQQDKNNGVILIIAPNERKVRIEVGRGLEPQLTDIMSKLIIENAILPALRRNDFVGGIKAGVRDIKAVLLGDAAAVKERARTAATHSGEGGGTMAVTILVVFIIIAFVLVYAQSRQVARPASAMRDPRLAGRRRDSGVFPASWGSSSGGWSGGGSDGGFSGGGGDFGGGGASGSW
jgi:uncharacterized protein